MVGQGSIRGQPTGFCGVAIPQVAPTGTSSKTRGLDGPHYWPTNMRGKQDCEKRSLGSLVDT